MLTSTPQPEHYYRYSDDLLRLVRENKIYILLFHDLQEPITIPMINANSMFSFAH